MGPGAQTLNGGQHTYKHPGKEVKIINFMEEFCGKKEQNHAIKTTKRD